MVPHATASVERRRSSSNHPNPQTYKFPDFVQSVKGDERFEDAISRSASPAPLLNGLPPGLKSSERWPAARREATTSNTWSSWASRGMRGLRRDRQKSLSEAIKTVRTRKASISENASEIADSLKAPVSLSLIVCIPD